VQILDLLLAPQEHTPGSPGTILGNMWRRIYGHRGTTFGGILTTPWDHSRQHLGLYLGPRSQCNGENGPPGLAQSSQAIIGELSASPPRARSKFPPRARAQEVSPPRARTKSYSRARATPARPRTRKPHGVACRFGAPTRKIGFSRRPTVGHSRNRAD